MTAFIICFVFLPFLAFLALYGLVRWWETPAGVSVFVLALAVNLSLAVIVLRLVGWISPHDGLREMLYTAVGVAGWVQLGMYLWTRYRRRTERSSADERTRV